jgi:hypothetical protein
MAGRPSSPGAFHGPAAITLCSISSTVNGGISSGFLCCRPFSASIDSGSGGKKVSNSSSACSSFDSVLPPFDFVRGGTFSNAEVLSGFRYFAACQIFESSSRNSC